MNKHQDGTVSEQPIGITAYGIGGKEVSDDKLALAKESKHAAGVNYYVSINRFRQLRNPYDKDYETESVRRSSLEGNSPYRMIACNKTCFNSYVRFLESKDVLLLRQAQGNL